MVDLFAEDEIHDVMDEGHRRRRGRITNTETVRTLASMEARVTICRVMTGLLMVGVSASSAIAQTRSAADYVRSRVDVSELVWVTATDGVARQGRIVAISESLFEVSILGFVTAFPWADIRVIEAKDPLKNGIILGGIIGGLTLAQLPSPRSAGNVSAYAAIGIAAGAATGAYADYLREGRDIIYRSGSPSTVIAPILFPNVIGFSMTVRW